MTLGIEKIAEADLLAYADGRLDLGDRAIVERFLAENPDRAAEVAEWQRQNTAIAALFGHIGEEPVPARLSPRAIAAAHRPAMPAWRMAAAALLLVALGSAAGWYARDVAAERDGADRLIAAALDAHVIFTAQRRHPVEVAANERDHLSTWLSGSLDRRLVVPASLPEGFTLVGGRLLPAAGGAAAQLMYEAGERRLTLYLTPRTGAEEGASRFAARDGLDALYWANDALTCTIVGDLSRAEMETIAAEVFSALNWRNTPYRGI